jgi:hypothetical protein
LIWTACDLGDKVLRARGMLWGIVTIANWDKSLIALIVFVGVTTLTNN